MSCDIYVWVEAGSSACSSSYVAAYCIPGSSGTPYNIPDPGISGGYWVSATIVDMGSSCSGGCHATPAVVVPPGGCGSQTGTASTCGGSCTFWCNFGGSNTLDVN